MKPKIVQYGAGNIGRSLVGQLFSAAGWEVVFVDVVPEVIAALNTRGEYCVQVKEETSETLWVRGVRGVDGRSSEAVAREIATCDLMSTAVGAGILPRIAGTVAAGLKQRSAPLNIILCENLRGAAAIFAAALREHLPAGFPLGERVGLVATSIGKMVPIMPEEVRLRDPLEVWAEAYNKIVADRHGFLGEIPQVHGLVVRECFEAFVDQKLFVHNLGHALAAYFGDRLGAVTIAEAMEDPGTARKVEGAMEESGRALLALYPHAFTAEEMREHIEDLCHRFKNRALGDTVYRVGRDRPRKYGSQDRLIGSLKAHARAGIDSTHTLEGTAAGLYFSALDESGQRLPADVEFEKVFQTKGVEGVLQRYAHLDPDSVWDRSVIEQVSRLKDSGRPA